MTRTFMSKSHIAGIIVAGFLLTLAYAEQTTAPHTKNLIPAGSSLTQSTGNALPSDFTLAGDVSYGVLGDERDKNGRGIRLQPAIDLNKDGDHTGSVTTTVRNITPDSGRWFRFRIRGLAPDNFKVAKDDLYLQVEFFRDNGTNSLDHIKKHIYPLVEQDRQDLRDSGTNKNLGLATWRSFDLEFKTPFSEVDTLQLTAGFGHSLPADSKSEF